MFQKNSCKDKKMRKILSVSLILICFIACSAENKGRFETSGNQNRLVVIAVNPKSLIAEIPSEV